MKSTTSIQTVALFLSAIASASASTIDWASLTSSTSSSVSGAITAGTQTVGVTYTGELAFAQTNNTGTYFYSPASTYTNAAWTNTPSTSDLIAIDGTATMHTILFSQAVTDPFLDIVSLGQPRIGTQYVFSLGAGQSLAILQQGPGAIYGGSGTGLSVSGSTLKGTEADGLVQFMGTFTSLTWTGANPEFWNGFDVGIQGVASGPTVSPEPETFGLLALAVVGLGIAKLKRVVSSTANR